MQLISIHTLGFHTTHWAEVVVQTVCWCWQLPGKDLIELLTHCISIENFCKKMKYRNITEVSNHWNPAIEMNQTKSCSGKPSSGKHPRIYLNVAASRQFD